MDEYLKRDDVFNKADVLTVYTKEYGTIEVVPVEYLADLPTADVAEVKHGRWIEQKPNPEVMKEFHNLKIGRAMSENSIYWTCSECGLWGTPSQKYCPYCGAKMDA